MLTADKVVGSSVGFGDCGILMRSDANLSVGVRILGIDIVVPNISRREISTTDRDLALIFGVAFVFYSCAQLRVLQPLYSWIFYFSGQFGGALCWSFG